MLIHSLTLENIKSYRSPCTIPFMEGMNFIAGRNGAGKTTIIEAIGYLIFMIRPYKYEELLATGAKSGTLAIRFEGNDQRTYDIERSIRKDKCKYVRLTDAQTGKAIEGEDLVREKLFAIHSVYSEQQLTELFEEIIAISQGKFTAPFLESATAKRVKFERIFGLESYRTAYQQSSTLPRLLDQEIRTLTENIKEYEGELKQKEELAKEKKDISTSLKEMKKSGETLQKVLKDKEKIYVSEQKKQEHIKSATQKIEFLRTQYKEALKQSNELHSQLVESKEAEKICLDNKEQHLLYLEQEKKVKHYDQLLAGGEKVRQGHQMATNHITKLESSLEALQKQEKELVHEKELYKDLTKDEKVASEKVQYQSKELEKWKQQEEKVTFMHTLLRKTEQYEATTSQTAKEKKLLNDKLLEKEKELAHLQDVEKNLKEKEAQLQLLKKEQVTYETLQKEMAVARATISDLQQKEEQCKQGSCPTCGTEGNFAIHFSKEVSKITKSLQTQEKKSKELFEKLQFIPDLEKDIIQLSKQVEAKHIYEKEVIEIKQQQTELSDATAKEQLFEQLQTSDVFTKVKISKEDAEKDITLFTESLRAFISKGEQQVKKQVELFTISYEKAKYMVVQIEEKKIKLQLLLTKLQQLREEQKKFEQKLYENKEALKHHEAALQKYTVLEKERKEIVASLEKIKGAHLLYLKHEKSAGQVEILTKKVETFEKKKDDIKKDAETLTKELEKEKASFDAKVFAQLEKEVLDLRAQNVEQMSKQTYLEEQLEKIEKKLVQLKEISEKKKELEEQRNVQEKKLKKMEFIRTVLNNAAGPIAKRMRAFINEKAAFYFRRLTRQATMLHWGEDFEVTLQDTKEHTRRFVQLSGGEQMIAALSIRLALMRYFSPFQIGFFDEPTQNLDEDHRRSFAHLLPHTLEGFRQIFLISHDDTFDALTENVVMLHKTEEGTQVM